MQSAHLVIDGTRKLVDANEVEHCDYSRIFQCSYCKETLHLRKRYLREGCHVDSAFIHPKGNREDCQGRVEQYGSGDSDVFTVIKRGQNSKQLEKAVLSCFQNYFRGWPGSKIGCNEKDRLKIPNYEYSRRFRLIHTSYSLPEKYIKKFVDFNSGEGIVHNSPELFVRVLCKIIRNKKSGRFVEQLVSDFQKELLSKDYLKPTLSNHSPKNDSTNDHISQHCTQLSGILNYLRFGSSDRLTKNVVETFLWANYKELPVLPTKIETNTEYKKRKAYMKHLLKRTSDLSAFYALGNIPYPDRYLSINRIMELIEDALEQKFEQDRKPQEQKIGQFTTELLEELDKSNKVIEKAYSDFYEQSPSPASQLIDFSLKKLVISSQSINWNHLPDLYTSSFGSYSSLDAIHHEETTDIECPISFLFASLKN